MTALDLVYNPYSGSFSEQHLADLRLALSSEGFAVTLVPTEADRVIFSGTADLLCIHGGDGTLRDTVRAMGQDAGSIPICVAPSGTVNLVARELAYEREPGAFARRIARGWQAGSEAWISAPLYCLGELPIVSCLSIGPDSHVVARVSASLKQRIGRYAYVVAMMQQLREWPREPMIVRGVDVAGERFECEVEAAIVSNASLYAGPFRLSPAAALEADSVELITIGKSTRVGTMALSAAAMLGLPIAALGLADIRSCQRIEFDRCVTPVQVDGDHMPDCAYAIAPSGLTLRYIV